ncbi:DUF554 domain-containing protein [Tissierella sp. MB52-C2]|uniref:DUF554 domain-containing protein n=1 Tax=Tissierella sp. MB52-C2 TaxID=3070999 RepID=UPI00280BA15A|nr:DUF554 domain-containing protein [Tissierella sp. MB52-C2]WMM24111.1 DUF554 domain-containing protein [Tissierella sp. MB52-C2]
MLGTIVNSLAIILGSLLGIGLRKGIKEEYKDTIMDGIGLCVIIIGITGGIKSENIILVIGSIVLGSLLGEIIGIENMLENLGNNLQRRFDKKDSNFSKGFVTASLVFCIGAMAIVGSLEAGIQGKYETLFAKSIIDGISSIIFASTLGIGVAFASIPVFIYQGSITLLANLVNELLTPQVVNEMSAVGSILIIAIGINILGIKKIKIGNMLPAVFIPLIYYMLIELVAL